MIARGGYSVMFLWKNAIVITILYAISLSIISSLSRSDAERSYFLRLGTAAILCCYIAISALSLPLSLAIYGLLMLSCVGPQVPLAGPYLFFTIMTPALGEYWSVGSLHLFPISPTTMTAMILWMAYLVRNGDFSSRQPYGPLPRKFEAFDLWIIGFVVIYSFCYTRGESWSSSARALMQYAVPFGLPFLLLSRLRIGNGEMALRILCFAVSTLGLICLFEALRFWPLFSDLARLKHVMVPMDNTVQLLIRGGIMRAYGPSSHPLNASVVLGLGLVAWSGLSRMRPLNMPMMAMAGLTALGLFCTVSRTGMVALAVGLIVSQILQKRYFTVLIVMGLTVILYAGLSLVGGADSAGTGSYRLELILGIPAKMGARLILGSRTAVESGLLDEFRQGQGIVDLVNVYLSTMVIGGLVSLAPLLLMFGWVPKQYRRLSKARPEPDERILGQTLVAMIAGYAVAAAFMAAWNEPMALCFACMGMLVAVRVQAERRRVAVRRSPQTDNGLLPQIA